MALQIFLLINGLVSFGYGAYCFFNPSALEEAPGIVATAATGTTAIQSLYGGVHMGQGAILLYALFDVSFVRPALLCLIFITGGIAFARLGAAILGPEYSASTLGLIGFELIVACIAIWLMVVTSLD